MEMHPSGDQYARAIPTVSGWPVAFAGLVALAAAIGIGRFAFTPILPMMQEDTGVTVTQGGWLASANYVGYLVGALWAMAKRVRSDRAIRVALFVTSAATIAMAYAEGLLPWLLLRGIAGASSAWALIHVTSWCLERLAPLRRPFLNGTVFVGIGAGIIFAGGLCIVLMSIGAGSREAWLALGLTGFIITAAIWPVLGVDEVAKEGAALPLPGHHWNVDSIRLVICYGAFGLGYIIPATFLPVMAKQVIQDPMAYGWAWPVFGITAVASTLFGAVLLRSINNRRLWALAASLMALGVVSPLILSGLLGVIIAAVLVGGTFVVTTMAGIQEARTVAGPAASVLVAAMTAAFAAGQIIGPLLVSALVHHSDDFSGALLFAFAILIASAIALVIPNKQGQLRAS